ncbi:thioredoxin domain-containing protein [Brytella acorum]|uniref:Thioredoxin domain-containing protein n=1 Tax=Brytella acorum TaxID=2959299 RepID=A0AA35VC72_9PROT|nr:thioredoxin domain-containing protein [Brytella acorum]MDF3624197.1 thioredoxin domain-containing protein [Brytella acorum]CAI9120703.1 thioredoxin domain-containing protein [Brytella acorum]
MPISRRMLLAAIPAIALPVSVSMRPARAEDLRLTERAIGNPKAPVHVHEWFSLTCTHCAHYQMTVFPEVKTKLIDTGKILYVYHDFPLDQTALLASMVARSLPVDRYEPFINTVLSSLDRWAFSPDGQPKDPKVGLKQIAALAGISSAQFDKIDQDETLRQAIVTQAGDDGTKYNIQGTPFFRFNNIPFTEELSSYAAFEEQVKKAAG